MPKDLKYARKTKVHPLAEARIKAGFASQVDFAEATGISRSGIANIERYDLDGSPRYQSIVKIAAALKITTEEVEKMFSQKK